MDHPERVASQMSGGTHLAAQSSTAQRRKGVAATSLPAEAGKLPMRLFAPTKR
ncbi:lipoprotein, putative [Xanthomonas oryzae pv. oryzae PXO99A]|uniref:Lipoprotein, putative n=6 Tax=Xanthomonas oryzae TaxID=347 RepID=A0A0K0GN48_XANOP|nr:lipoprotein, putative [Xanthomonas oryzae pv. oryzae PXO99A]